MKTLIGVTGQHCVRTREVVKVLLEALNLMHINMRQPLIDFCAESLALDAHHLEHHVPLHSNFPEIGMTLGQMQNTIAMMLCSTNKDYLVNRTAKKIDQSRMNFLHNIFNGHVVSNIVKENEAHWIRAQGGILVHVRDRDVILTQYPIAEEPHDEVIVTSRNTPPTADSLRGIIRKLITHFQIEKAKAAA